MDVFCTHHEQAALMSAEGYFSMSGKMAINVVTTGPGGTNTMTGLLGMWTDSIPSVIISGQVGRSQLSKGTGCRQIGDQEIDIIECVKTRRHRKRDQEGSLHSPRRPNGASLD